MKLFAPGNRNLSPRHKALYAAYEIAFTTVDFLAAFLFVIGSVMFFYKSMETPAIWCFLVGSVCFALKPTLRLARELHYLALGDVDDIAGRFSAEP
ncbi:MAG: YrhK family protein [Zhengella sp.]|uniref:YrhK family protein n=1 Tax=Zhengella sp. TaxID=2282762 RepID=UPI001DD9DF4A|nr:YrhK family protein [Notoacmeibacter sp.]MCC0025696.1 YrhK family protein [Brucellaceae bacterium]